MQEISVLVVDDQEPFRQAVAGVVEATHGFALVGSVASGEDALAAVRVLQPRLVLMDVHLPGIDGVEAARRLHSAGGSAVVFLLSSYEEGELDLSGCGAATYIPKSRFGPDRLAEAWARRPR